MENIFKHFWCHVCKTDLFQNQGLLTCACCGSELIEEVEETSSHPSTFVPQMPSRSLFLIESRITIPVRFVQFLLRRPEEQHQGATEDQINSLENNLNPQGECSICQEKLENYSKKTKCKHEFHENCIFPWLRIKNSCPVCRTPV
jgi:Zinc finger, C3HC4 type (RING finger)